MGIAFGEGMMEPWNDNRWAHTDAIDEDPAWTHCPVCGEMLVFDPIDEIRGEFPSDDETIFRVECEDPRCGFSAEGNAQMPNPMEAYAR